MYAMAFTRFYDDPDRVMKKLQESTGPGLYSIGQPGNGNKPHYIKDPSIILQKWGANLYNDRVNVESELLGINYRLNQDTVPQKKIDTDEIVYPVYSKEVTSQSRVTVPVWTTRDLEQTNFWYLPLNPQENVTIPFEVTSTRLLEKDKKR
jgi:hypothetical protein